MEKRPLSQQELRNTLPGEAITLTAVMAILAIGIIAVVAYNLFKSKEGTVKLPGGFTFEWN